MSAEAYVRFASPLRAVSLEHDAAAAPTAAQIELQVRTAYEKGREEATVLINQQILEQRAEANFLREKLFHSLEQSATAVVTEVRRALPLLTMQALRRLLSRVEITRETVQGVIDELLGEIGPDVGPIELRLHPTDLKLVEDLEPQLARIHPGLRLVGDESLARGDCEASTRFGKVDARLKNKLGKLETSLIHR